MNNTRGARGSWLRQWLRQAERGEDQSFEFTSVIVPIMIMIMLIAFGTLVRAAQMPVWTAASECARMGIASADETSGRQQAEEAALASLTGNAINISSVDIDITGDWTPNSPVTCRVSYDIDISGIAGFAELTGGRVPVLAEVTLRTEPFKSKWR